MQHTGQGVADLRVATLGRPGQVVAERARGTDWVAVRVQAPGGEVVGVHVHPDQFAGAQRLQRHRRHLCALPGGVEIPALLVRAEVDAVGHRLVRGHPVGPFLAPMRERHRAGQDVAAMGGVGQVRQRCREPNR
jgi:hypothetical protein